MKRIFGMFLIFNTMMAAAFADDGNGNNPLGLPDGLYAHIETNRGVIVVRLEYEKTPMTVMNFIGLAEGTLSFKGRDTKYFYDGLTFHRVIKNFMIQGGDPLGNGRGDPGYRFPDEFDYSLKHDRPGILSMANSGPNTNGSQFFITHVATPWLNGRHTVFGHVVKGQDVVNAIEQGDVIKHIAVLRIGAKAARFVASDAAFKRLIASAPARAAAAVKAEIERQWPGLEKARSGLFYKVLKKGSGTATPRAGTVVTVHYKGQLLYGNVFDSSYDRKEPARFTIGSLIPGMNEALLSMKKGEKKLVVIPPELGYGERGAANVIPPNAWLVFEIELLGF